MKDTEESWKYWESELVRLKELRDNQEKARIGIDYVNRLMANAETILPMADIPPDELRRLPKDQCNDILAMRREIVVALVDKVEVWASGLVHIYGVLDGSEAARFDLASLTNGLT
jgi:hypothetical protein